MQRNQQLLIRLNWPGKQTGHNADGLVCPDQDGLMAAANVNARNMLGHPKPQDGQVLHASDMLAVPLAWLFDQYGRVPSARLDTVHTQMCTCNKAVWPQFEASATSLRDFEATAIRKTIDDVRGNLTKATKQLDTNRSTLHGRLGRRCCAS